MKSSRQKQIVRFSSAFSSSPLTWATAVAVLLGPLLMAIGHADWRPMGADPDVFFHDRFETDPSARTLQFYSGRIESVHLGADDAFYGNFLVTGQVPGYGSDMSLYRFGADAGGQSQCSGGCAQAWPPLMVASPNDLSMPGGFLREVGVIERQDPDGWQVTVDGWPLYLYGGDEQPGETTGHLAGQGIWQLIVVSQITAPPPADIDPADHETWNRGLNAWRMPRPMIGACVNCHSPDAYDIARVGFSADTIRRRAIGDGLGEAEANAILGLVELQRDRYDMTGANAPFEPMAFRPLQPGGMPLDADGEDDGELAFIRHLREDHQLMIVSQRIGTVAEARAAAEEIANLDMNTVRVGFPFERFSEDPHHGRQHNLFLDWIPFAPHEVIQTHNDDWYALQDAYIANPSPETLFPLMEKVGVYTTTCRFLVNQIEPEDCNPDDGSGPPGGYGEAEPGLRQVSEQENPVRTRTWNNIRYRNILLLQHMMREENERLNANPDDPTAGLLYLPSIHRADFLDMSDRDVHDHIGYLDSRFTLWNLAQFARPWIPGGSSSNPFPPQVFRDRIDYAAALDSHLTDSALWQRRGGCRDGTGSAETCYWILTIQGLRASWFWMGFVQDPQALIRGGSHEYFHQTANQVQDIRLHTMFASFASNIHRSYRHDTFWRGAGPHSHYRNVLHLNERFRPNGGLRFAAGSQLQTTAMSEERLAEHRLLWGNINRMTLLLMKDELQASGKIHRPDLALSLLDTPNGVSIEGALIGNCDQDDHRFCVEEAAFHGEIQALIAQVRVLLESAEDESFSGVRRTGPESLQARQVFGEYNRLGVGENARGVPATPIPRIDRPAR